VTVLTEAEVGKAVVTTQGQVLGEVVGVDDETAQVVPNKGALAVGELLFGWDGTDDTVELPLAAVDTVTEETVVLDEHLRVSFEEKNVPADVEFQESFFGSYGYWKDGEINQVTREFQVYTDEEYLGDGGKPLASVAETHIVGDDEDERRTVEESSTEFGVDLESDPPGRAEVTSVEGFCRWWHTAHAERK